MKKLNLIFIFIVVMSQAHAQNNGDDLPAEFNDVAVKAFAKLSPATKQWFINTASQHPAGQFDTVWTKKKLREKFGVGGADPTMELFIVMMAYQKMMNKEAREDKKIASLDKDMALAAKEEKLRIDNTKIDQQKKEADEKAANTMTAAQTNLWIGIVSGNSAIAGGGLQQGNQKMSTVHSSPAVTQKIDSPKTNAKNSELMQKQVDIQEKQVANNDEAKKSMPDQKTAMKDAVKKLQDQMAHMKADLNP
jgi:hypothetical protein